MRTDRFNVLGVGVSAIDMQAALTAVEKWIESQEQHYICVTNVHLVMEGQRDQVLRRILNTSGLTTPDGMPLVWLGRLLGYRHIGRVYGPDLMLALSELSARKGYKNFYYGGVEQVPERVARHLKTLFPALQIVGTFSPPFRPLSEAEDARVVEIINASDAEIVWVGLGAPKQEKWMASHIGRLRAPVLIGVGAAFDFHSARISQAPRWMMRLGLEWLYRLFQEPRRLWKRYLINNPLFVALTLAQALHIRRFSLD